MPDPTTKATKVHPKKAELILATTGAKRRSYFNSSANESLLSRLRRFMVIFIDMEKTRGN
jgi:hypothetical protein